MQFLYIDWPGPVRRGFHKDTPDGIIHPEMRFPYNCIAAVQRKKFKRKEKENPTERDRDGT